MVSSIRRRLRNHLARAVLAASWFLAALVPTSSASAQTYGNVIAVFQSSQYTVSEDAGSVQLAVILWDTDAQQQVTATQTLSFPYATADGSAVAGTNYTAQSGTVTFNPGDSTQYITVPILASPNQTTTLSFTAGVGSAPNVQTTTVNILPDSTNVTVTFDPNPVYVGVGNSTSLTVTVTPSSAMSSVTLVSADPTIATVSGGPPVATVTGIAPGQTTIQAVINGQVVGQVTVYSVCVCLWAPWADLCYAGDSITITPTVIPAAAASQISYVSDNTNVGTVSGAATVTAVGAGSANCWAVLNGIDIAGVPINVYGASTLNLVAGDGDNDWSGEGPFPTDQGDVYGCPQDWTGGNNCCGSNGLGLSRARGDYFSFARLQGGGKLTIDWTTLKVVTPNTKPYPGTPSATFDMCEVTLSDGKTKIKLARGTSVNAGETYFCHGHTFKGMLGAPDGKTYSIYGDYVLPVFLANYNPVGAATVKYAANKVSSYKETQAMKPQAGDVVIFLDAGLGCVHSCVLNNVAFKGDGSIDLSKTTVSTKNGITPLNNAQTVMETILIPGYQPAAILYGRAK